MKKQFPNGKFFIILISIALVSTSCAQWKTTAMKQQKLGFVPAGEEPGNIMLKVDDNGLQELTVNVGVFDKKIFTIDNVLKRVQLIDPDEGVELIIGSIARVRSQKYISGNFKFNMIGAFTVDSDGNIYIQNILERGVSGQAGENLSSEEANFPPSYVLVFNSKGELQYTLGQRGTPDLPFYHIDSIFSDAEGRLFIVSSSFDNWKIFRFKGKERNYYFNLSELEFTEKEGDDTYTGKIEGVKIYHNGEMFLISVAYYQGIRLKYRKVYDYSIADNKITRVVFNLQDPKNVLYMIAGDKHIYFWNVDGNDVKLMICNLEGDVINNILINSKRGNSFYTGIVSDDSGKLYSYNVTRKGLEVFEWE